MKQIVKGGHYTFSPSARQITLTDFAASLFIEQILLITDVTNNTIIYQFNNPALGGSVSGNLLTLTCNTTGSSFNASDHLQIIYEAAAGDPIYDSKAQQGEWPDSQVLFDDHFSDGLCGWEALYQFQNSSWNNTMVTPLTLGTHGYFGKHNMLLQTNAVPNSTYGGQAVAIKRLSHQYQKNPSRIVEYEVWFSFGGSAALSGSLAQGESPLNISFQVDNMVSGTTATGVANGARSYFKATWNQLAFSSGYIYNGQWSFSGSNGIAYGQPGYVEPDNNNITSGYYMDFPYNQNKRGMMYIKLAVNTLTGQYISLKANHLFYDLTNCPSLNGGAGGPLPTTLSPGDLNYNTINFNGGLNALVSVTNPSAINASGYVEVHRARMTYR